jgi:hypothetical protein
LQGAQSPAPRGAFFGAPDCDLRQGSGKGVSNPVLSQNLMTFSDLVRSREFAGFSKAVFEPS